MNTLDFVCSLILDKELVHAVFIFYFCNFRIKFTHHVPPAASITGHSEALAQVLEDSDPVSAH